MNAKEAREKSLAVTGQREKNQYIEVKKSIERAADSGLLSIIIYDPLMPAVSKKLIEEGYKVSSYFDQREGTTVTIKW